MAFRADPPGLMTHLARHYFSALEDLPDAPPRDLLVRFFGWLPARILRPPD